MADKNKKIQKGRHKIFWCVYSGKVGSWMKRDNDSKVRQPCAQSKLGIAYLYMYSSQSKCQWSPLPIVTSLHDMQSMRYVLYRALGVYLLRLSASCTRVSGLLHALSALTPTQLPPSCATGSSTPMEKSEENLPVTSYPCQWKAPIRKQSNLKMADAVVFEKLVYGRAISGKKHQTL